MNDVLELNKEVEERIEDFFRQTEMCWKGFVGGTD